MMRREKFAIYSISKIGCCKFVGRFALSLIRLRCRGGRSPKFTFGDPERASNSSTDNAARSGGRAFVSQSVCGGPSSNLSLAVSIAIRRSASARVRFRRNASSS
jgi:hypothetical protein